MKRVVVLLSVFLLVFVFASDVFATGKKEKGNKQKQSQEQSQTQQQSQTATQNATQANTQDVTIEGDKTSIPEGVGRDFTTGATIPIPQAPQPVESGKRPWNVYDDFYRLFGDKRTVFDFEINKLDLDGTDAVTDAWGVFVEIEKGDVKYHNPVSHWKERDEISTKEYNYIATSTIKCESTASRCYFRMHKECQERAGDVFELVVKDHSVTPESGSWGIGGSVTGATLSDGRSSSVMGGGGTGYSKAWLTQKGMNQALIKIYRKKSGGQTPERVRMEYRKQLEEALKKAQ